MKPYIKVLVNKIRFLKIRVFNRVKIATNGIQILGYNTRMVFKRNSSITLGNRVTSDGRCVLIVDEGADLKIGDYVYFNEGMMISCKSKIEIGDGCQFGPNVKMFDNNHCFDSKQGIIPGHKTGEIVIGKNCWIAANVTILKDAKIADNCVIGAGCVIKGVIPESSIVTQSNSLSIKPIRDKE